MSVTRTNKIVNRILRKIKQDKEAPVDVNFRLILDSLTSVQLDLARRGAIKEEIELTLEAGTSLYDLYSTIYKISGVKVPSTWLYPFEIIANKDKFSEYENTTFATAQPLYGMVFNSRFKLTPTPSTTGENFKLYTFLLPSKDLTMILEPEVGVEYDKALEYGALADQIGGEWEGKFEREVSKILSQSLNETTQPMRQEHWQDNTGF